MPTLTTWVGKSTFPYSGTVATGTDITCGSGHTIKVPLADYTKLLSYFTQESAICATNALAFLRVLGIFLSP